ncbi:MAG TPA: alanine--tRNA ligase-related protein, partial [Spirochaetota bacterium]|nr:alanine--tRNA ligase-related protein [Spirochaetota bacterium]
MLQVKDLRDSFIDFFREHNHKIVPSSPLIPKDDPTLLFTTAGMVQFKPMFAGTV